MAVGYRRPDGTADVAGFAKKKGYDTRSLYPWVNKGRRPERENLQRLAKDLQTSEVWLLFGDAARALPSSSALALKEDLQVPEVPEDVREKLVRLYRAIAHIVHERGDSFEDIERQIRRIAREKGVKLPPRRR